MRRELAIILGACALLAGCTGDADEPTPTAAAMPGEAAAGTGEAAGAATGASSPVLTPDQALRAAIVRDDLDGALAALADGADVSAEVRGATPLHMAARLGRAAIAQELIDAGADVEATAWRSRGDRPLHLAAMSDSAETVEVLLEAGADIEAAGDSFFAGPPLAVAASAGSVAAVEALVAAGAELEAENIYAATALVSAAFFGQPETVRALVEAGADVNADRDGAGHTPRGHAEENGYDDIVAYLDSLG
ncbi:ankyrin repeat domain-containing protein [Demequina pelophila]|uniref:ankyrin repeat domain-containing protein n=1 Tax=Demequina pelophila TaxID=1638984 RepID=UPI000782636F|nr:ankyrin repeat domain-containing protein [Demequina pelophila]